MSEEDFKISEITENFDLKLFLLKLKSYWWLFLVSIGLALLIVFYLGIRKLPIYEMKSIIEVKDNTNPLLTSNTSLTFKWGGISNQLNTTISILKSRTHNEEVVKDLEYYIEYLQMGDFQLEDVYGNSPFSIQQDSTEYQLQYNLFKVEILDEDTFELSFETEASKKANFFNYFNEESESETINPVDFKQKYKFGEHIDTFFFKGRLIRENLKVWPDSGTEYYFRFASFYNTINKYKDINVEAEKNSSIVNLSLEGNNKARMVDYLNGTINKLIESSLEDKNLYATRTIEFIDFMLVDRAKEMRAAEKDLESFKTEKRISDLDAEGEILRNRLTTLDKEEREVLRSLDYYNNLKDYLVNKTVYSEIPAPSFAGISETNITLQAKKLIELSNLRNQIAYTTREDNPKILKIDRDIEAVKNVLLENIGSSIKLLEGDLRNVKAEIAKFERQVNRLPTEQQDLFNFERRYDLIRDTYELFLTKRDEARLIKAASVSDINVIDFAKDTGEGKIGPDNNVNYAFAFLLGFLVPLSLVYLNVLFDNKVNNPKDIESISNIPILGVVGKSKIEGNLAVLKNIQGPVAESFRNVRASLQFLFKHDSESKSKVILITSSISGEGKTFTSINIASVLSLSNKKTILLGMDLRKPKIYDDFGISNEVGIVNYLIGKKSIDEIKQASGYKNLDIITSGPIPPNPSEILINNRMDKLLEELRTQYEYIIIDTPPLGLVSDALNIITYVDTTLYLVRQNFTKKGMLSFINEKYKSGEVKNINFVLNYFERKAKYGYGHDYGYGYGYGKYGEGHEFHQRGFLGYLRRSFKKRG